MKKEERLHRLFGDIDDDLVADAAAKPIPLKVWLPRVTAAVAAVALTVGLAIAQPWASDKPPITDGSTTITHQPQNDGSATSTPAEVKPEQGNSLVCTGGQTLPAEGEPHTPIATEPDHVAPPRPSGGAPTTAAKAPCNTQMGATTTAPTKNEVWYEPQWDEKPIWMKFSHFERFEIGSYTVRETATLAADKMGEFLEDVNLYGYDIYTETAHEAIGKIYRIEGIYDGAAVALQYPEENECFVAVCSKYYPTTLGDLIDDLSLRQHLQVGTVYHSYRDTDGTYHDKEYAGLTTEKVWELLLCDESLRTEYDDKNAQFQFNTKISIRIDVPLLGYHNISISLSENGYLRTNLLDTEKLFHIGEDKVDAFMAYVEENCRLQKDDELIPMPGDTNAVSGTTMTTPAQPPLETGTTVWKKPDPVD